MFRYFPFILKGQFSVADPLPYIENFGDQKVELKGLDIEVKVTGLFAETSQTMRFFNPGKRDLEGSLNFSLPGGAVVCGYSLDIGGEMIEGVVASKPLTGCMKQASNANPFTKG